MRKRLVLGLLVMAGCATAPPRDPADICSIFREKDDWYEGARQAEQKWGLPIPVQMAIIKHESAFEEDARPPRVRFLGIPLWHPTSAYGYGQVLDGTWDLYTQKSGHSGGDRDDLADVADFIGWYAHQSQSRLGIPKHDAYNLYLAYHEGWGGWRRRSHVSKPWLLSIARKVAATAQNYERQLYRCRPELEAAAE
ncbi:transglycosylase SLT domain-containing protein [Methylococcus geothermalis]|uniref:Transglycosylase SLT domain-containing protein n=1 Tax=Methylococcus geothermalis TaxID=2681310 RepID=A0A858QAT9_9GAMM|nr:transglycosylase SLT domain-containing protein [Methylococcus geothermalis]QJD31009.1 hypothetical protein GNH96_14340 [Methylococcus geothermalis]